MKPEELFTAIGEADENLLEHSERTGRKGWRKWGGLAACLFLAALVALPLAWKEHAELGPGGLPILEAQPQWGGMGFEGYLFYDISESDSANPWTPDAQLETLPVFRNLAYTDGSGVTLYLNKEEMLALAEKTAAALEATITKTEYEIEEPQNPDRFYPPLESTTVDASMLTATTNFGEIWVLGNGTVRIFFEEPQRLPEEYNFTYSNTSDEAAAVIQYLLEKFATLVDLEDPVVSTWGDYSFSGAQLRNYDAFDGSGDLVERILQYNFNKVHFANDDNGDLMLIDIHNLLSSAEKLGNYPIISWERAREFLLEGAYFTSVPEEFIPAELEDSKIAKVELVYRCGLNLESVFMPYYRFLVEMDEGGVDMAEGLKNYGAFYVPAVNQEFLSDFPVWDGRFHA